MNDAAALQQGVLQSAFKEMDHITEERQDQNLCVICLDIISQKAIAQPCQHDSFDFLCLTTWLEQRQSTISSPRPGSEITVTVDVGCPLCTQSKPLNIKWEHSLTPLPGKTSITSITYNHRPHTDFQTYQIPVRRVEVKDTPFIGIAIHQSSQRSCRRALRRRPQRLQPTLTMAIAKRKDVYRDKSYSLHVGTNRLSRFRDITPQQFRRDEELVSRARKWIRRELQVFDFLNPDATIEDGSCRKANNAEFLLEYIIAIIKSVDIRGSGGQAYDMLQEFLGSENSSLFLHELQAWLRSPYTQLDDWDRHVQYGPPKRTCSTERHLVLKSRKHDHALSNTPTIANNPLERKDRPRLYDSYRPHRDRAMSIIRHRALD